MSELKIKIVINGDTYSVEQIEYIAFEREKHVLQEMIHMGASIIKDGKELSYDDVDYLHRGETTELLYQAKLALGADGVKKLYKAVLDKSDEFWRKLAKKFDENEPMQEAVTCMSVEGMSFMDFAACMKAAMNRGEDAGVEGVAEHFPASEINGLAPNEKNCLETMGMYGGPVEAIVSVDPIKTGGIQETDGFKNMISGTSRLLDGTPRHDVAVHQFRIRENGFDLKMTVLFPKHVPQEMVTGHCLHLAIESMETVKKAFAEKTRTADVRFMDRPEDYEKLGITPGIVEMHEDGRQHIPGKPGSEVWYFDAVMEDGTKFVGGFRNKPAMLSDQTEDKPLMVITITDPDGTVHSDTATYAMSESRIGDKYCDFHCGSHYVEGNLKDYHIHIEPIDHAGATAKAIDGLSVTDEKGIGVDLNFRAEVKPFRHGAGRTLFDNNDDTFSSWLCIPRMNVRGTVTVDGRTKEMSGTGYHDHRCMALNDMYAWHHWLWGRQIFEDYTVVIYDLVTAKKYGYTKIPLFAIYDKNGEIIFDNDGSMECDILEMQWEEISQKDYPKAIRYRVEKDETEIEYCLSWREILEVREMYWSMPEEQRKLFDQLGVQISYNRYFSDGKLKITQKGKTIERTGTMIYEFAYIGAPDSAAGI